MSSSAPSPLLGRYVRLATRSVDEAVDAVSRAWIPHRIELLDRDQSFASRVCNVSLSDISLGYVCTTGRMRVSLGPGNAPYHLRIRLSGFSEEQLEGKLVELSPVQASLQNPGATARAWTDAYTEIIGASMDQHAVVRELEGRLGRSVNAPVVFHPAMNLTASAGANIRQSIFLACQYLDSQPGADVHRALAIRQLERSIIATLVEGQRHNYTRFLHRASDAAPWQVRAAEDFIRAHAEEPLTLGDLARVAGVPARTLQYSFRRFRGVSPSQFLRITRLERAHLDLRSASPDTTVSLAAMKWGFLHLGRFAALYRRHFGEPPSATLLKSRLSAG